jgi:importin subunit beta-1
LDSLASHAHVVRCCFPVQGDAGHTAALVIAKVAAIEVPRKEWPELIQALLANMGATPSTKELRQSTLEALGYTCEELGNLEEDYLSQQEVNSILTAVVQVQNSCPSIAAAM